MDGRINDKIREIEKYIEELGSIKPPALEEYIYDFRAKAACERYAEKIIEAVIDLAFLIVKDKKLTFPENDIQTFDILLQNKIIAPELCERLQDAKRMRNILAHEYGEVDDEIVFHAVSEELEKDTKDFIRAVKAKLI